MDLEVKRPRGFLCMIVTSHHHRQYAIVVFGIKIEQLHAVVCQNIVNQGQCIE